MASVADERRITLLSILKFGSKLHSIVCALELKPVHEVASKVPLVAGAGELSQNKKSIAPII